MILMRKSILLVALVLALLCVSIPALAQNGGSAEYTVLYWVEKPDIAGDPGNPLEAEEDIVNFIVYDEEIRTAAVNSAITLSAADAGEHLYSAGDRPFASYLGSDQAAVSADGATVVNVYYARDAFTYVFTIGYDAAEMTVDAVTYKGNGNEKYTVTGKYEQSITVPGVENGLLPKSTNPAMADAVCVGWLPDERTGSKALLSFSHAVSEQMLPTKDMPYKDLVFSMKGVWFNDPDKGIMACWYEQLPEEENQPDLNRMTYNNKVYVNYPLTNFEFTAPRGTAPQVSSVAGLNYLTRIDPPETDNSGEVKTWQFIYDRELYKVSFNTNGAGTIASNSEVMYRQNLYVFDPGWDETTTRNDGGTTYRFEGWFTDEGDFVSYSLSSIWMPAFDLHLNAKWTKAE